jgi:hypothetical protein
MQQIIPSLLSEVWIIDSRNVWEENLPNGLRFSWYGHLGLNRFCFCSTFDNDGQYIFDYDKCRNRRNVPLHLKKMQRNLSLAGSLDYYSVYTYYLQYLFRTFILSIPSFNQRT